MKNYLTIGAAALIASTLFMNCKNDSKSANDAVQQADTPAAPDATATPGGQPGIDLSGATPTPTTNPTPTEPPQNTAGVWHYTCAKGCAGGAGSAVACATCGAMLLHNTAYHGNTPPASKNDKQPAIATPAGTAPKVEPPQNKAGVWHYTCVDGCAGGNGSALPCSKCGKTLVHNTAYHQ